MLTKEDKIICIAIGVIVFAMIMAVVAWGLKALIIEAFITIMLYHDLNS